MVKGKRDSVRVFIMNHTIVVNLRALLVPISCCWGVHVVLKILILSRGYNALLLLAKTVSL